MSTSYKIDDSVMYNGKKYKVKNVVLMNSAEIYPKYEIENNSTKNTIIVEASKLRQFCPGATSTNCGQTGQGGRRKRTHRHKKSKRHTRRRR